MFSTFKRKIKFLVFRFRNRHLAKISLHSIVTSTYFEGRNSIARGVQMHNCKLGYSSYVSNDSILFHTKIGRFCCIADHVHICLGNHPTDFVTMHPSFYYDTTSQIGYTFHQGEPLFNNIYKYPKNETIFQIVVGNDVWIGSHALIMGGITIGDGAVVAAGAVVVRDVEPYSIVAGVPARIIKKRFSSDYIEILLDSKWWERPFEEIESHYKDYVNIDEYIDKCIFHDK